MGTQGFQEAFIFQQQQKAYMQYNTIGPSDNGSAHYWPPGSLYTLGVTHITHPKGLAFCVD